MAISKCSGRLIGELSTWQVAHSLYVASSTVRTRVKSIYCKLGVSSREQAVGARHAALRSFQSRHHDLLEVHNQSSVYSPSYREK
jgi:hypothetical protein